MLNDDVRVVQPAHREIVYCFTGYNRVCVNVEYKSAQDLSHRTYSVNTNSQITDFFSKRDSIMFPFELF